MFLTDQAPFHRPGGSEILVRERIRLAALDSYGILDTQCEPEYDALAARAAARFRMPIAVISLIDDRRQWFKARIGLTVRQTDKRIAFCTHTVTSGAAMIVRDATRDDRFRENPLVTADPLVRFYAGAPLITPLRRAIGTLAVIDSRPRWSWTERDTEDLVQSAADVMAILERRRADLARRRALAERPVTG